MTTEIIHDDQGTTLVIPEPEIETGPGAMEALILYALAALKAAYSWQLTIRYRRDDATGAPLYFGFHSTYGLIWEAEIDRSTDEFLIRVRAMSSCNEYGYQLAALLFAAEIGTRLRKLAHGMAHVVGLAPDRKICINMIPAVSPLSLQEWHDGLSSPIGDVVPELAKIGSGDAQGETR